MRNFLYAVITGQRRDLAAQLVKMPLIVASWLYGAAVRLILAGYHSGLIKRRHLSVPVISVGNLTLGGVGKTPMVIYVARLIQSKGLKPVILTRGYMPPNEEFYQSDEAQVLEEVLDVPVVVNPNRYQGGLRAIERHKPDVLILDDGFQHWQLFRNLDIVLIDASMPFGNRRVLPAGILREPLSSLKRADVVVLTRTGQLQTDGLKTLIRSMHDRVPLIETAHRPTTLKNILTGHLEKLTKLSQPLVAFCGIGNPNSFKTTLASLHADVKAFEIFPDHHPYTLVDMERLKEICLKYHTRVIVTTQKDAVKLTGFTDFWQGYDVYSLNIDLQITQGEHEFAERILHLLHG
jgi:tetraacyldisaccharide 4'-kinase